MTQRAFVKNFVVKIENGIIAFTSPIQEDLYFKFLEQFEGKNIWLTIDQHLPIRTERQNRFYWLYLNIIANETGHISQELHNAFKQRFLHQGVKRIYGEEIHVTESTTALSKLDFGDYLTSIEELTGTPLPDASIFGLAPLKYSLKNE